MIDTNYSPVFLIRSYIWQLLKHNLEMQESDYGGLTPIVPVSEQPEITQYDKPYIIYGYAIDPTESEEHWCQRGSMSLVIYGTNFRQIAKIMTTIEHTFNREDIAAKDLNDYTTTVPSFRGIRFTTVSIGFSDGPAPEDTEGGRESGLINIRFEYLVDYNVKTNPSEW